MTKTYTIQQAASLTGLSVDTLRYYERIGLLQPVARNHSGHRRYTQDRVTGIEFVVKLRSTGMSVARVRQYIALARRGAPTVAERRKMLEEHGNNIKSQIAKLNKTLRAIEYKLTHFDEIEAQVAVLTRRIPAAQAPVSPSVTQSERSSVQRGSRNGR